jgi:hypothetical protein
MMVVFSDPNPESEMETIIRAETVIEEVDDNWQMPKEECEV